MITLLFILIFFLLQTFILLCCVAAGNDAASQEIADQVGISKGTVTSRFMRARDQVRRNLEDNGYERGIR